MIKNNNETIINPKCMSTGKSKQDMSDIPFLLLYQQKYMFNSLFKSQDIKDLLTYSCVNSLTVNNNLRL